MENFLSLPMEKQTVIIDAALMAFGTNGYKKASISDIAASAGISKSMVFHYFGTKKELYMYLINYCGTLLINEVNAQFANGITDFFERIKNVSRIEISIMKKHPAIMSFLNSMYFEENKEVKEDIKATLAQGEDIRNKFAFEGVDTSKFKEDIDIKLVLKILIWMTDGFMNEFKNSAGAAVDFENIANEFYACMELMKNNFYKEG